MGLSLLYLTLFIIIPPGIMVLGKTLKDYLINYFFGRRRSSTAVRSDSTKEGLNRKLSKRIKFTMRDTRKKPIPFKLIFILTYLAGASLAFLGGLNENYNFLLIALAISYVNFIFSAISANGIVKKRDAVLKRMLELKGNKMRFINKDKGSTPTPFSEFRVLEWSEDLKTPVKMHLFMPTEFDILQVDSFLESFNLNFGGNGQWISDDTDKQYGGFDFNAGVAAIRVSSPLPKMAMWHERYLNSKDIHWSFFPLALGSENGVPVFNDELNRTEHVLGFAVNGGQEKLSKKNGVVLGSEVTSSPQILIAGGTGGGKSLASNTKVKVIIDKTE